MTCGMRSVPSRVSGIWQVRRTSKLLTLLRKECGQYLKSIVYYLVLIYLVFDYVIQMGNFAAVPKPQPGRSDYSEYGTVETADSGIIMQESFDELLFEFDQGYFVTYPLGFYKKITPSGEERAQIQELICELCGRTEEEILASYEEYGTLFDEAYLQYQEGKLREDELPDLNIAVRTDYPYETFLEKMEWLDQLLGGGSNYSKSNIQRNAGQSPSYEQACEIYDDFIQKDKVTSAYARLFCDYEGITLALVTVFLAAAMALRDRRAKAEPVIYARQLPSAKLVLARYLAGVVMTLIPVFLLNCVTMVQAVYYAGHLGVACDYFAGVRYIAFWLLPTILVTFALGYFLTELTGGLIAILVQFVWWFGSLITGELVGVGRFSLIPRFNAVVGYAHYESMRPLLLWNRCFYTMVAAVLVILTVLVYDAKRKGVFLGAGTRLRNRKNKLEA